MRRYALPFLFLLAACGSKQDNPATVKPENTDYLISLDGIGPVKTEMTLAELETVLKQKIPLTNPKDTSSGSWMDSAFIKIKEADLRLSFVRTYAYKNPDSFHMRVSDMRTSSPLFKTINGIGVGSSRLEVCNAFDNYRIYMGPETVMINDSTWVQSKDLYQVRVREHREGPQIVFYVKDNKVYQVEVGSYYDDQE